jgi:hypothetical protein
VHEGADVFAACPSAEDLARRSSDELALGERQKVDGHLQACALCREDLAWLARTSESKVVAMERRRWVQYGAVAAVLAALAIVPFLRHPSGPVSPYADLVELPVMNRGDLMATLSQQKFAPLLEDSLNAYSAGDFRMAESKARAILATLPTDPSALFVAAMAEYGQGKTADAEKLMDQSERTQPMTAYRCWAALQLGLATGSRARVDRECKHLAADPAYGTRARQIEQTVSRRGA